MKRTEKAARMLKRREIQDVKGGRGSDKEVDAAPGRKRSGD